MKEGDRVILRFFDESLWGRPGFEDMGDDSNDPLVFHGWLVRNCPAWPLLIFQSDSGEFFFDIRGVEPEPPG